VKTDRIARLAGALAGREAGRVEARRAARELADRLHGEAERALEVFRRVTREQGAPHLDLIRLGPVEPDAKSVRAFEFRIRRGRHVAIVVTKDRGEVLMVGPFRRGETEGPCRPVRSDGGEGSLPDPSAALEALLADLIEAAFTK